MGGRGCASPPPRPPPPEGGGARETESWSGLTGSFDCEPSLSFRTSRFGLTHSLLKTLLSNELLYRCGKGPVVKDISKRLRLCSDCAAELGTNRQVRTLLFQYKRATPRRYRLAGSLEPGLGLSFSAI